LAERIHKSVESRSGIRGFHHGILTGRICQVNAGAAGCRTLSASAVFRGLEYQTTATGGGPP
jgi:hypothetical protein